MTWNTPKLSQKDDISFSDNFLALFAVMVAKLDFPVTVTKRKMDKLSLSPYPVHLREVLILFLFSRSRESKESVSFVIKKITTTSSNSVNFILKIEMESRT